MGRQPRLSGRATRRPPALLLLALTACGSWADRGDEGQLLAERAAQVATRTAELRRDSSIDPFSQPVARWLLPQALAEVSGLTLTGDMRLLAHNDERSSVYEVDYRRGIIGKEFMLGDGTVLDDFEGIAVANDTLFLVTSHGRIYETVEGQDSAAVPFRTYDVGIGAACEIEGAAYDRERRSLVLACKNPVGEGIEDALVLYRWPLREVSQPSDRLVVPRDRFPADDDWNSFHASGVAINPATGNYVVIAAQERVIVEITPEGRVVMARRLPATHAQAEGVALTDDLLLIVSDEAREQPASITVYAYPRQ